MSRQEVIEATLTLRLKTGAGISQRLTDLSRSIHQIRVVRVKFQKKEATFWDWTRAGRNRNWRGNNKALASVDAKLNPTRLAMALYKIVSHKGGWGVFHDGSVSGDYITKEAAFEAIIGPASNAIKMGQAVVISVEASQSGEPSLGKR
jgi:hypothetical protein